MGGERIKDVKNRRPLRTFKGLPHTVLSEMRRRGEEAEDNGEPQPRRLDDESSEIQTSTVLQVARGIKRRSQGAENGVRKTGKPVRIIGKSAVRKAFAHTS